MKKRIALISLFAIILTLLFSSNTFASDGAAYPTPKASFRVMRTHNIDAESVEIHVNFEGDNLNKKIIILNGNNERIEGTSPEDTTTLCYTLGKGGLFFSDYVTISIPMEFFINDTGTINILVEIINHTESNVYQGSVIHDDHHKIIFYRKTDGILELSTTADFT